MKIPIVKSFKANFDHFSWLYFAFGYFIMASLWDIIGIRMAFLIGLIITLLKEIGDIISFYLVKRFKRIGRFFDFRGLSWADILLFLSGVAMWLLQFKV